MFHLKHLGRAENRTQKKNSRL